MHYSNEYKELIDKSIRECSSLLENPSIDNYIKLCHELDHIISCSQLEDHTNNQIIAEKTKYIVDSLVSGDKISQQIQDVINKSLTRIRDDVANENYLPDLKLIDEIKMNYDMLKKNEKDFMYTKNLKVLLITSDNFLSNLMKENVDASIQMTVFDNYSKAFDLVQSTKFDVIICDILEDSTIAEDFILGYSKSIPMAVFYRSSDLQLVLKTAKLGIKDIISSDEIAIKYLTKTLHNIYSEWIKQRKKFLLKPVLEDPNMKIILHDMLLTELPIFQKVRSYFTIEVDINSIIKESYNLKVNELIKSNSDIIDSLVKEKFLIKNKVKNILVCPNCDSVDLDINFQCHSCDNKLFTKYDEVFAHENCGFTGLKHDFISGSYYYCPKCNIRIENFDDCVSKPSYYCQKCSLLFSEPLTNFRCNFCDFGPFTNIEGRTKIVYRYDINPALQKEFKKNFFILEKVSGYLTDLGYGLSFNEKSGTNITTDTLFDLVARKEDQMIIFVILTSFLQYNIELLYQLEMLRSGSPKVRPIVLSLDEPDQLIINILLKFKMFLIVSDNAKEILEKTKIYLNQN